MDDVPARGVSCDMPRASVRAERVSRAVQLASEGVARRQRATAIRNVAEPCGAFRPAAY